MLRDFVELNREEILASARRRVSSRSAPLATSEELTSGLPIFLDQLCASLARAGSNQPTDHVDLQDSAEAHGRTLYEQGLTAAQVVHDYGDLCQVITGLAVEERVVIAAEEFQTLNLCLDDAIAGAVTAYGRHRERAIAEEGTERLGILAHEMRNVLNTVMLSFASIKRGMVAPGGSTGAMLERNLLGLQTLIDRSLADVRLDAGLHNVERVPVWEVLEEVAIGAVLVAEARGLKFEVTSIEHTVIVAADRQILAAAIANLLQNALKFTARGTKVSLRASSTATRVLITVEDECGGLPAGASTDLLVPFSQRGANRTGLGLGLAICKKAMDAMDGELRIEDLPGRGCIFTVDLPKQPPPPTSIHAPRRQPTEGSSSGGGRLARAI